MADALSLELGEHHNLANCTPDTVSSVSDAVPNSRLNLIRQLM